MKFQHFCIYLISRIENSKFLKYNYINYIIYLGLLNLLYMNLLEKKFYKIDKLIG